MTIIIIITLMWMGFGALLVHSVKTEKTAENKQKMKDSLKSMHWILRSFTYIFVIIYFLVVYLITPISIIVMTFRKKKP